jgi:hypothetical protein
MSRRVVAAFRLFICLGFALTIWQSSPLVKAQVSIKERIAITPNGHTRRASAKSIADTTECTVVWINPAIYSPSWAYRLFPDSGGTSNLPDSGTGPSFLLLDPADARIEPPYPLHPVSEAASCLQPADPTLVDFLDQRA